MKSAKNLTLSSNAKALRRNMTKEERHLWYDFLRTLSVMVHRQKVIGAYIVDFYIASANLVIELDGSQHYDQEGRRADRERDAYLSALGLRVLRYSNADVNDNFSGVCQDILRYLPEKAFSLGRRWQPARADGCGHTAASNSPENGE